MQGVEVRPRKTKRRRIEAQHQEALFTWVDLSVQRYPELRLLHAGMEGGQRFVRTGLALKRAGLRKGFPDVRLPVPRRGYHGLFIEMKAPGGRLSDDQKEVFPMLEAEGNRVVVCYSWEAARDELKWYLEVR